MTGLTIRETIESRSTNDASSDTMRLEQTQFLPERERRKKHRKPLKRGVTVVCRRGLMALGPNLCDGGLDIHDEGICLKVREPFSRGEEVELSITGVGRGKPIILKGDVRWVQPAADEDEGDGWLVGVQFRRKIPYIDLSPLC
jgi:PilZ domain